MAQEFDQYRERTRFGSLDGLRGLAVLGVVWHHTHRGFALLPGSRRGYLGVDLFFVLSGFLITTLLLREQERCGRIALGRFYGRRALRIFPLYYGILAALTLLFVLRRDLVMARPFFGDLPFLASYTSNWIHGATFLVITWSLAAEEQFYLVWPPLLSFLGVGAFYLVGAVIVVGTAVGLGLVDPALAEHFGPGFRQLDMVQATFNPISWGVLAGRVMHGRRGYTWVRRLLGRDLSAPILLFASLALANLPTPEPFSSPRLLVQLLFALLVASCVVREDHGLAPLLHLRPLARIGVVSYGIYLLHMFALQGTRPLLAHLPRFEGDLFLATAAASWALAELSFRYWEGPFLRRKARLRPYSSDAERSSTIA